MSSLPQKLNISKDSVLKLKSGNYIVLNEIGKGGFGIVFTVKHENTGTVYALKILSLWEIHPDEYSQLTKRFNLEFKIGRTASEYLVESYYFGFIGGNPYIVMELCPNGNLNDDLYKFKNEEALTDIIYDILHGLNALHQNGFIHRDIKPENILYSKDNKIKIADYGISADINSRLTSTNILGRAKERFGSILFSAPETFKESKYFKYTMPTMDIYALGVTLYYLASGGNYPIGDFGQYEKDPSKYISLKEKGQYTPLSLYSPHLSNKIVSFISKCIEPKVENRFQNTVEALRFLGAQKRQHRYFSDFFSENSIEIVYGHNQVGSKFNLDEIIKKKNKNIILLGRKSTEEKMRNDIEFLEDNTIYISKMHATIEKIGDDWYLRDGQFKAAFKGLWKNSLNGTLVNDELIKNGKAAKLEQGAVIKIGEFVLKFNKKNKHLRK